MLVDPQSEIGDVIDLEGFKDSPVKELFPC